MTLFDIVSSVALRPIDPFVMAFRALSNRTVCFHFSRKKTEIVNEIVSIGYRSFNSQSLVNAYQSYSSMSYTKFN